MTLDRRTLVAGAAGLASAAALAPHFLASKYQVMRRRSRSRVAVLKAGDYSESLQQDLLHALKLFSLDVRGKLVLLKPNLVDSAPGAHINTHPVLVAAAAECFRQLSARSIVVGEGPGHQRDTMLVLSETGLLHLLQQVAVPFVDLNRDVLAKVQLRASYSGLRHLWLPKTVLEADFIVSMPKVKTHHWAGVTLSLKNMFGIVPGLKYGWPKNILHWRGIHESVLDVCATVPIDFVIADAIIAMEGNGPLAGGPRPLHRIVLADDPVAADATCARLMGFMPHRVPHIAEAARFLGNGAVEVIDQIGEPVDVPDRPFSTVPEFAHLRAS